MIARPISRSVARAASWPVSGATALTFAGWAFNAPGNSAHLITCGIL